eukprot:CFRG5797T1
MRASLGLSSLVALTIFKYGLADDVCTDICFTDLTGDVDDCCQDFSAVDALNKRIHPILDNLRRGPFFAFYKTNVFKKCPFWADAGECGRISCAIRECTADELPEAFSGDYYNNEHPRCDKWMDHIVAKLPEGAKNTISNLIEHENERVFWEIGEPDENTEEDAVLKPTWYNLVENPERFTGYIGDSAAKVWRLIYEENCFHPVDDHAKNVFELLKFENVQTMCVEKRIFYRLISGLHTSITVHVASEYFDESTKEWAPNTEMFYKKFSPEYTFGEGPRRLRNLYFVYLFILRAIEKAAPYWENFDFYTGDANIDQSTKNLVMNVVNHAHTAHAAFDETVMFGGDTFETDSLKVEFKEKFHNVSRIMDCVECSKCRMWGKLQIEGLATAIKILFTNTYEPQANTCPVEKHGSSPWLSSGLKLRRNEIVSLFQTLEHFSYSINQLEGLRNMYIPNPKDKEMSKMPNSRPIFGNASARDDERGNFAYGGVKNG